MYVFHKISRAEMKSKLKSSAISIDSGQQTSEKSLAFEWEMRYKIKKTLAGQMFPLKIRKEKHTRTHTAQLAER